MTTRWTENSDVKRWLVVLFLILAVFLTFWPAASSDFVHYDDDLYVLDNPHVRSGLTWEGTTWAFTNSVAANWHPLTWISHMADVDLFGLDPGRHHLVNLVIHATNAVLCFLVFQAMTGSLWRSALVALLFAIHPLHVESVAWIAERKDLLCGFFWFLCMRLYLWYAGSGGIGRYLLLVLAFALGLMAKPMLVTLPFVLVLLDYWPLNRLVSGSASGKERFSLHSLSRLLVEKIPLFALAAASSLIAFKTQASAGAVKIVEGLPLSLRIANALVSYVNYLSKTLWPSGLAVFYPHPGGDLAWWKAAATAALLLAVSLGVLWKGREHGYLPVGWFWYVGTLVPVIGLVQIGNQALADRYTYLPLVGIFLLLTWGGAEILGGVGRQAIVAGMIPLLVLLAAGAYRQTLHWKNTETLFTHAVSVTEGNYVAHYTLGRVDTMNGKWQEAIEHYTRALAFKPDHADANNNLGALYFQLGMLGRAEQYFRSAVAANPRMAEAYNNLGLVIANQGAREEAVHFFLEALRVDPSFEEARRNLERYGGGLER